MLTRTVLITFTLILGLSACHKDSTPPKPPIPPAPPATTGTMTLNLTFGQPGDTSKISCELIISEPGGKVLLDTLPAFGVPVKAVLNTNAKLVDVTAIESSDPASIMSVSVFKSVDPTTWMSPFPGSYYIQFPPRPAFTAAQTVVHNFPSWAIYSANVFNSFVFSAGPFNSQYSGSYPGTTLNLSYRRYSGNYNYFAAPGLGPGLYKLYVPAGDNDTLDCNHLDTLVSINFDRSGAPAYSIDLSSSLFFAIPDTTNFLKSIDLIGGAYTDPFPHADLVLPREAMQKYELVLAANLSSNDAVRYYCYGRNLPTAPAFPSASSFSVNSTAADNFSVSFTGTKPSYCMTSWQSGTLYVNLYSRSDSTNIHLLSLLNNQKGKLLTNFSVSNLALRSFSFENVDGLSYSDYFSYMCNPGLTKTRRVLQASGFSRTYP